MKKTDLLTKVSQLEYNLKLSEQVLGGKNSLIKDLAKKVDQALIDKDNSVSAHKACIKQLSLALSELESTRMVLYCTIRRMNLNMVDEDEVKGDE